MASLHQALSSLGPTDIATVPQDAESLASYLQSTFKAAQTIIDSVPLPSPSESPAGRRLFNDLEISSSSIRSDILDPENDVLRREWGKPLKLNAKDNPLGMSVYKMAGKDGRGAWFARRSIHEGLHFERWKSGFQREFRETLLAKGAPGEGNVRGIGAERQVLERELDGVGKEEVFYLSAQFPGPSAPRDFVTLLLTSSDALKVGSNIDDEGSRLDHDPRHFMVVSKPCIHPECPPRTGFVRGQYESVEFIREVPRKPKRSVSAMDLTRVSEDGKSLAEKGDPTNVQGEMGSMSPIIKEQPSTKTASPSKSTTRKRGKTTSFVGHESHNQFHQDESNELGTSEPVEWIMITRSDPGGSVPRFMVERGTPGSIVADAGKFVEWASKDEVSSNMRSPEEIENANINDLNHVASSKPDTRTKTLTDINETASGPDSLDPAIEGASSNLEAGEPQEAAAGGVMASVANAAIANIEAYAPKSVVNRLPGRDASNKVQADQDKDSDSEHDSSQASSPTASFFSFASADDPMNDTISTESPQSQSKSQESKTAMTPHEKELAKLQDRKKALDLKLERTREKETKDKAELSAKEGERVRKAEEKHAREVAKQEERYSRQVAKLDAKKRKAEEKDERVRLGREREDLRQQLASVRRERDILKEQVGALQRENTGLVVRLGKMEDGKDVLKEVKAEALEGSRSRSGSLRRSRPATPEKIKGTTALGRQSTLQENVQQV